MIEENEQCPDCGELGPDPMDPRWMTVSETMHIHRCAAGIERRNEESRAYAAEQDRAMRDEIREEVEQAIRAEERAIVLREVAALMRLDMSRGPLQQTRRDECEFWAARIESLAALPAASEKGKP